MEWPARNVRRSPLQWHVSRQEGETSISRADTGADPEGECGHQGVTFVDDVVISYHGLDALHVARIAVDWFYGED